jgi:hypothetical protein
MYFTGDLAGQYSVQMAENSFAGSYKVQLFSVSYTNFYCQNTFKAATCFGSIQPSSGHILRTDPYNFSVHFGFASVYIDGVVIT